MVRGFAGSVCVLLIVSMGMSSPLARAEDPFTHEQKYTAFYTPPDPLPPGEPGDLIRTEPARLVLEPSGQLGAIMATGTRIMYRSTDSRGNPNVVTGMYFEPHNDWPHGGPRPLIAYGPGTQGQGDQCAPSRMFSEGIHWTSGADIMFNYEEMFVATMVARGFAIIMTDYEGLGTPGVHTYVNRLAQGHALIDAARAAKRLPGTSLDPDGPVAFWGYSQGGGAAASAAELASTYGPELDVVGTYAGSPPADLVALLPFADGSVLVGALGYALNGAIAAYPEAEEKIRATLTPRGAHMLDEVKDQCVGETLMKFAFRHLQPYFNVDIFTAVEEEPFKSLFELQRLGGLKPEGPVLINANRFDPLVPWAPAMQMGRDWCAMGADVEARTNEQPPLFNKLIVNHGLPMLVDGEPAMQWIADRFKGVPTAPNCGRF